MIRSCSGHAKVGGYESEMDASMALRARVRTDPQEQEGSVIQECSACGCWWIIPASWPGL